MPPPPPLANTQVMLTSYRNFLFFSNMTKNDIKLFVELFAQMLRTDEELRTFFLKEMLRALGGQISHNLSLKEASRRINKSQSWLYKNKDRFSYVKTGGAKSSPIMFDGFSLLDEYEKMFKV